MKLNIGPAEERIMRRISDEISDTLNRTGIFFRVFNRLKSTNSIEKKLSLKKHKYLINGGKIQDVLGIRTTLYFADDEKLAIDLVKKKFQELPEDHSIDVMDDDRFGPTRCNMIFKIPNDLLSSSRLFEHPYIDATFEIQFRTVFSEGWHEVEHDLRYKCKDDWENCRDLNRQLNGQFAVLQSCDWTILKIFDELAYKKYKSLDWPSLFRNVLRIRFSDFEFSEPIKQYLSSNNFLAKELLRIDRTNILYSISSLTTALPLSLDLVLLIINRVALNNRGLKDLESPIIKQVLDNTFYKQN